MARDPKSGSATADLALSKANETLLIWSNEGSENEEERDRRLEELKDAIDQAKDVTDAAKGKPRRGRKPKAKK